jgi:ribosomal protein S18 acetylase RimI-like enzyme
LRGYLAYADGLAVDDAHEVGSIVCFVVASAYRKQGVATRLLDVACAEFRPYRELLTIARRELGRTVRSRGYESGTIILARPGI